VKEINFRYPRRSYELQIFKYKPYNITASLDIGSVSIMKKGGKTGKLIKL
jgi:hypothetical protein